MCDKKRNANRILWERLDHGRTIVECIEKKLRGVTVGQPVTRLPPAQIPACGTTALGSSEILASVKVKLIRF
jgi:hypothetical protein